MKDWRTSLTSAIAAIAGFVAFSPELFDHHRLLVAAAKYICVGGLAAFGITAADAKRNQ